MKIRDFQLKLL